jgi:hypothetical protein
MEALEITFSTVYSPKVFLPDVPIPKHTITVNFYLVIAVPESPIASS